MKAVKKEDFLVKAIVHEVRELKNTTDAGITEELDSLETH